MFDLDYLDILFVIWAFFFQIALIIHFALRKRFFESYTMKVGWIVYALSVPAVVISIVLLLGRKTWSFWLGGFLFLIYAAYGYWIDYVKKIQWRKPLRLSIMFPYVFFISEYGHVLLVAACPSRPLTVGCIRGVVHH